MKSYYNSFFSKLDNKDYIDFFSNYLRDLGFDYRKFLKLDYKSKQEPCKDKKLLLEKLREEIGDCKRCDLYKTRTNIVFGVGNPCSRIMFIGEAPGEEEDLRGEPFVGRAGRLLDKMLESIGLSRRENVYIANVLKSRPPDNKISLCPESIPKCLPFLLKQIEIISPKIICCLGSVAVNALLKQNEQITKIRGKIYDYNGITLIPTYHPSYLLRNPIAKKEAWEDFKKIKILLKRLEEEENV
ncbi:MAG: uracil-DNA glycosylase [Proteobacteria bacterium]|nr:uracil-DNA glycosylase [Pseudomonadota bacterium]